MNRLMHLPGHARIWIFQADRELQPAEEQALAEELLAFQQSWKTHGSPLNAGVAILFSTFAIVAVDEKVQAPSGCSIDKAFRLLQDFGQQHNLNFFDHLPHLICRRCQQQLCPVQALLRDVLPLEFVSRSGCVRFSAVPKLVQ